MGLRIQKDAYDTEREIEGVWCGLAMSGSDFIWWEQGEEPPFDDDRPVARILVARASNPRARQYRDRLTRRYRGSRRADGTLPPELESEVAKDVLAHTVLLDWAGLEDEDGNEIPHDVDTAKELLKSNEEFLQVVSTIALSNDLFAHERMEEDAETLGNTSGGGVSGAPSSTSSSESA